MTDWGVNEMMSGKCVLLKRYGTTRGIGSKLDISTRDLT